MRLHTLDNTKITLRTWGYIHLTILVCYLACISRVSNQNGVSLLYIMLEMRHSGWEPSIYAFFGFCWPCHYNSVTICSVLQWHCLDFPRWCAGNSYWKVSKEQVVPWLHRAGTSAEGVWSLSPAVRKVPGVQLTELHYMDEGVVLFHSLFVLSFGWCLVIVGIIFCLCLPPSLTVMLINLGSWMHTHMQTHTFFV